MQNYKSVMNYYCQLESDISKEEMKSCGQFLDFFDYFKYADAMECDPLDDILNQNEAGMIRIDNDLG